MQDAQIQDKTLEEILTEKDMMRIFSNANVIANIIELTSDVILNIAGSAISDTIKNSTINRNILANMIGNKIKTEILGGK